jgi:chemotaxis protein CheC
MPPDAVGLSQDELDTLQELMNVAFGKAGAELAEALELGVGLTVPAAQVMPAVLLRYYVGAELKGDGRVAVLEQGFEGDLQGGAFLVLPETVGEEKLRRMGEVLVRGCVRRLAELLGSAVRFGEPMLAVEGRKEAAARADVIHKNVPALILGTAFHLDAPAVTGHLFLATSPASMRWLEGALARFLAQYA